MAEMPVSDANLAKATTVTFIYTPNNLANENGIDFICPPHLLRKVRTYNTINTHN